MRFLVLIALAMLARHYLRRPVPMMRPVLTGPDIERDGAARTFLSAGNRRRGS